MENEDHQLDLGGRFVPNESMIDPAASANSYNKLEYFPVEGKFLCQKQFFLYFNIFVAIYKDLKRLLLDTEKNAIKKLAREGKFLIFYYHRLI